MNLMLIGSYEDVSSDLFVINQIAAQYYAGQDYIVEHGVTGLELVGKNAETGEDAINAQRTLTWDEPRESGDAWFIFSPSNDPRLSEWKNYLGDYVLRCEEIENILE